MKNLKCIVLAIPIAAILIIGCKKDDNSNPVAPTPGTIQGQVTSSGNGIAGVTVTTTPTTSTVTTDASGNYYITNVSPGTYTITATKTGYNNNTASVTVAAGQTVTANITLTPSPQPGTTILNENFDSGTVGSVPSGWSVKWSGDGSCRISNTQYYSSPNSFRISSQQNSVGAYYKPIAIPSTDSVVVTFRLYPSTSFSPVWFVQVGTGTNGYWATWDVNNNRMNYGGATVGATSTLTQGNWYLIKCVINVHNRTANWYINGSLDASNVSVGSTDFTGEGIELGANNGANRIHYYDDVLIIAY